MFLIVGMCWESGVSVLVKLEFEPTVTLHWLRSTWRFSHVLFLGWKVQQLYHARLLVAHLWYWHIIFFPFFFLFKIVGIITRHNLTHEFLQARLRQHYQTIWCPCPTAGVATSLFQACTRARILLGPHKAQDLPFGFSHAYQAWGAGKHLASQRIRGAAWARSCWLVSGTWFDHSWSRFFFFFLCAQPFMRCCLDIIHSAFFLRLGQKNHLAPLCPMQRTAASFPCLPVRLFPSSSLVPATVALLVWEGVAVKAERR